LHRAVLHQMLQCVRLAAERRSLKMCSYRSRVVQKSGGIFSDKIITNVIPIPTVKNIWKSVNIWRN